LFVETPHQRAWRLTAPGVADQLLEIVDVDGRKPNQDGREADIVRLGEELTRVSSLSFSARSRTRMVMMF